MQGGSSAYGCYQTSQGSSDCNEPPDEQEPNYCMAGVRNRLSLKPGDIVIFEESEARTVCIRKAEPLDVEFLGVLETTLPEWNSDNDDRAYRDL